jgi:hypothetical protein
MRNKINLAAIAIIFLTAAATTASAQLDQRYRAEIPFDFSVGKQDMKAGQYALGLYNSSSGIPVLGITNRDTGEKRFLKAITRSGDNRTYTAVLRFVRDGEHYELAEVKGSDFDLKLKSTWSQVNQVVKGGGAGTDTETVSIYLH